MIKKYYQLAKPGIILGNAITAAGGFALASRGHIDPPLLLATLIGISLIIGASCVLNNFMDRIADEKMIRTKNRALVQGTISLQNALIFATLLGLLGALDLALFTNFLSLFLALLGVFVYLVLYTLLKYRTVYSTLIGSVAGGIPPVVGYTAVTGQLDGGALLIFLILVLWQMPHFFAIAMYRVDEFAAASIQVLPIKRGMQITKIHMLLYTIAFLLVSSLLTLFGYTGYFYLVVASLFGLSWIWLCAKGFSADNDKRWARKMFVFSLQVITFLSLMISIDVA
jgi:protoheme IX farnesyltransferase